MCGTVDSLVDAWHGVSAPVVDTGLGRAALTVGAGAFGGPLGAALMSSALTRNQGGDWGSVLRNGALSYGAASLAGGSGAEGAGGEGADAALTNANGATDFMGDYGSTAGSSVGSGATDAAATGGGYSLGNVGDVNDAVMAPNTPWGASPTAQPATVGQGGELPMGGNGLGGGATDATGAQIGSGTAAEGAASQPFSLKDYLGLSGDGTGMPNMGTLGKYNMYMGGLNTLGGIYQAEEKKRQADSLQNQMNDYQTKLNSYYAPGSPEAIAMQRMMDRKDAAAGRNSQYGTRATDVAAAIAKAKMDATNSGLPYLGNMQSGIAGLRAGANSGIMSGLGQTAGGWGMQNLWG